MSEYLVIGAGPIGTSVAEQLASSGHHVTVVSRSGNGPHHAAISLVAADATDGGRIAQLATGASAVFNCANPPYHRWPTDWPPIAAALLQAAETSGAVLVTMGNLYPYGAHDLPLSPDTPLSATYEKALVRATMWRDALRAHEAGRVRATEVRASDFIGPAAQGLISERLVPRILAGKSCQVLWNADVTHSWTYTLDAARTLVECAQQPAAWGRVWHAPTNAPRTQRQVVDDLADVAGVAHVKVSTIPALAIAALGLFNPLIRELPTTKYQFMKPFTIDDSATRRELGLQPTPWNEVLSATIAGVRRPQRVSPGRAPSGRGR
jgi:nucleoside-diphosphate-sugar epimerase